MKVFLEVYGCTANKGDASLIKGILIKNSHEIVNIIDDADFIIILTCTVIGTTEQKILFRIKELKKLGKKIIIAGCMASVQSELIKKIIDDALFLPPKFSHHVNEVLEGKKIDFTEKNKTLFHKKFDNIIAPISIAEGCMFSCSYCITTFARGKLKSYPTKEIMQDVKSALIQGCKEIQLTAQDTSSYGLDINTNLGELISVLTRIKEDFRIRIGMMNPYTASLYLDDIINSFRSEKIYNFIHIPVQSGDNDILKMMNRKYSVEGFIDLINNMREELDNPTISTDIIVGYPLESNDQFQNTVNLIKKIKPDITNITRFSARPYTNAKKQYGRIKTEIVKKRSKILTKICSDISKDKNLESIGRIYNVFTNEIGKHDTIVGRSENYKPVVIKENVNIGEFYRVKIVDASQTTLFGRLI